MVRPDPQALWEKGDSSIMWGTADATFVRKGEKGMWHFAKSDMAHEWPIQYGGLTFLIRPTAFKHVGLFPEQRANWEWMMPLLEGKKASVLNLFAYTGGATLAAAKAGASVTHVDASKTAVEWARENTRLSGLDGAPVRWIIDDVMKYVEREIKRGTKYDAVILDPPAFGHGPKDELWKIERDLVPLMKKCRVLLSDSPLFVLMNGYAAGYSHLAFEHLLEPLVRERGGTVEGGELTLTETNAFKRSLPCGIYARWSA